ncbi:MULTISPECIES: hypothetical protein [Gordonia]|uniref:Uncharacterized protein n=1 Tax=Gordonia polyisoprenivorans TaxID=84595 RepID=A0A846WR34_9ACTN|nr:MULTISPECIES: hypothetical protein [Gordonia]NKY03446.1 hypothetical protein [Gordonia polyisoprenivorans]OPX14800.1 hypothetical protein B1964_13280 [Gordonia sp. i37]
MRRGLRLRTTVLGSPVLGAPRRVPRIVGVVAIFVDVLRGAEPEATTGLFIIGLTAPTTPDDVGDEKDQPDEADDDAGDRKPQGAGDEADDK